MDSQALFKRIERGYFPKPCAMIGIHKLYSWDEVREHMANHPPRRYRRKP